MFKSSLTFVFSVGTNFAIISLPSYENNVICPPKELIFRSFEVTTPDIIKVVILGQDPYHKVGVANGLAFSVNEGDRIPPSLKNIFREICNCGCGLIHYTGDLTPWAKQGVLLLNTVLTVKEGQPNSHKDIGWIEFTNNVISYLDTLDKPIAYMLWGKNAMEKIELINSWKARIYTASHPSPFSANLNFFGCGHFKKVNSYLRDNELELIKW